MATEQDAARDRVLAARTALDSELGGLEASARYVVDIPARFRQSPGKVAAVAAAAAFLLLRGPARVYRLVRRAVTGSPAPMPKAMLPKEIEKTLRSLGDDGDKVRGVIERDFADYAKKAEKDRRGIVTVLLVAAARPLITRAARTAGDWLLSPGQGSLGERLDEARATAAQRAAAARSSAERTGDAARAKAEAASVSARERVAGVRAVGDQAPSIDQDPEATGI